MSWAEWVGIGATVLTAGGGGAVVGSMTRTHTEVRRELFREHLPALARIPGHKSGDSTVEDSVLGPKSFRYTDPAAACVRYAESYVATISLIRILPLRDRWHWAQAQRDVPNDDDLKLVAGLNSMLNVSGGSLLAAHMKNPDRAYCWPEESAMPDACTVWARQDNAMVQFQEYLQNTLRASLGGQLKNLFMTVRLALTPGLRDKVNGLT